MRHQCQGAFRHLLVSQCQPTTTITRTTSTITAAATTRITSSRQQQQHHHNHNHLSVFCRRLTQISGSHNNNNNERHQQQFLNGTFWTPPKSRTYSKFDKLVTDKQAMQLICQMDEEELSFLRNALCKMDATKDKKLFESQLAVSSWRTRFGRLSNKTTLGQVDPTGTFCAMPDEWLKEKLVASAVSPTFKQLSSLFIVNAVPFLAFGFLDNFIMIMAGDLIEIYLGHFYPFSTMAAAGLGNTVSDILGITMATYVEEMCHMLGLQPPGLTPAQFELKSSKRASSWGRIVGITIGCLIGMCPLWFTKSESDNSSDSEEQPTDGKVTITTH